MTGDKCTITKLYQLNWHIAATTANVEWIHISATHILISIHKIHSENKKFQITLHKCIQILIVTLSFDFFYTISMILIINDFKKCCSIRKISSQQFENVEFEKYLAQKFVADHYNRLNSALLFFSLNVLLVSFTLICFFSRKILIYFINHDMSRFNCCCFL